jgi:hypothetical protein
MPLRVDCPSRRRCARVPTKFSYVAVEQLQRCLGEDHVLASNRRQFVDHDASRASAIIRVAIERQDLAAIGARSVDGALELGEAALHELCAIGAGRQGNLDPGPGLTVILPMRGEHDRVAQAAGLAEPQAVLRHLTGAPSPTSNSWYCAGAIAWALRPLFISVAMVSVS